MVNNGTSQPIFALLAFCLIVFVFIGLSARKRDGSIIFGLAFVALFSVLILTLLQTRLGPEKGDFAHIQKGNWAMVVGVQPVKGSLPKLELTTGSGQNFLLKMEDIDCYVKPGEPDFNRVAHLYSRQLDGATSH